MSGWPDLFIISLEQRAANRKYSVIARIAWTMKDTSTIMCLPLPSRGCKSAMECQGKVQWTLLLWFLHSQWSTFELKREYRMLFCALTFMNIQSFFFCRLLQAHTFCQSTFHVCRLPHYSILPYWWTQLGATVLHIEITDLGQNFLYAVVDEETHCWRTSAIKCTLYVQILFNTGDHTADLDISHFYIIKKLLFFFFLWNKKKVTSLTLWAAVP